MEIFMPRAPHVGALARAPTWARDLTHSRSRIEPARRGAPECAACGCRRHGVLASLPAPIAMLRGWHCAYDAGTVPNRSYLTACPGRYGVGARPPPEHREATESRPWPSRNSNGRSRIAMLGRLVTWTTARRH